ncbi:MAG TPA: M1 family aminopeptidase [Thermoanaerobaculia bacterium]|jgi:hypothetical protein
MRNKVAPFLALVVLSASPSVAALEPANAPALYASLQQWHFSSPSPLAAPVTITRGTASWTLSSGSVRMMKPLEDGSVTGLVFEGSGRFTMTIPNRFELAQLRRFSRKKDLEQIDQPITQLVMRTSDPAIAKLFPMASGSYSQDSLATKRHTAWMVDQANDNDARLLMALLNRGSELTVIDANTKDFGWLTWEYDSTRGEEIVVSRQNLIPERWISLDAKPPAITVPPVVMSHVNGKADLTRRGKMGEVGQHNQRTVDGRYSMELTLTGAAESVSALLFDLHSTAREVRAYTESNAPLFVVRDHLGKRSAQLDNRFHDDDFVVILDQPLKKGEQRKIRFEYDLETANYAMSRDWYPNPPGSFEQRHTARLELTVRRKNELRSMGTMESRVENGDRETSVWVVSQPVKMLTFSTATAFEEIKLDVKGIPRVVAFGPDYQLGNSGKLRNVGADVANALQYFNEFLGEPVTGESFYVTSIAAGHGQAFEGFLHLSEDTFISESPGASELFRAHEVAHEWMGHKVGWTTYRDQWISEAFAEYLAMQFVHDTVKGGAKFYDEMLRSYTGIVMGNMAGGFSKFNRPWLIERSSVERARLGPIGHGWRASTGDIPFGYVTQTYYKGPLVLHMLRMLLQFKSGNDEIFWSSIRDFIREHSGKAASTADFQRIVERKTNAEWGWFFDSWIYGADIPSYTWRYDTKPAGDGGFLLTIDVERRDVPEWFTMPIPVRVEFDGGKAGFLYIPSKPGRQTITQKIPARPKNVVFAPNYSVLANIRRD